jgi:hypothetical protein
MDRAFSLTGSLHRYFAALDVENQLCRLAAQGAGPLPEALQSLTFDHTALGLRTGYTDHFKARLCGVAGEMSLSLPADVVRKLARMAADMPAAVGGGFSAAAAAHNAARYSAPAP